MAKIKCIAIERFIGNKGESKNPDSSIVEKGETLKVSKHRFEVLEGEGLVEKDGKASRKTKEDKEVQTVETK